MLAPADLIFDLTVALRDALAFLDAERGLRPDARLSGVIETLNPSTDATQRFDAEAAHAALAQADAWPDGKPGAPRSLRVPLTADEASRLSEGLADILCWSRGFIAGRPDQPDDHPMGVEAVRAVRDALCDAIAAARGQEPEELPF